jgi:aspartyl/asparaginyl-tRNA synthetase
MRFMRPGAKQTAPRDIYTAARQAQGRLDAHRRLRHRRRGRDSRGRDCDERYLTQKYAKKAVIVMNYPKAIKAFYMRAGSQFEL